MKNFFIIIFFLGVITPFKTISQCNIQASICEAGVAGPFNFQSGGHNVFNSSCLDQLSYSQYGFIVLYITTSGQLNMLINGNASSGFLDVAVFNVPPGVAPCTAIQSSSNEINCNYADFSNGCNQFGNSLGCTSSVPSVTVTAGQTIMIVVEDYENGPSTSFTLELAPGAGNAQTGLPNPSLTPESLGPFCTSDGLMQLLAVNNGGTWSGPGVTASGMFNPAVAGPGVHTIDYSIGLASCSASSSAQITVGSIIMDNLNVSGCQSGGTYNVSGNIQINTPPSTGQLIVENCEGQQTVVASAPFSAGSIPFNLNGLLVGTNSSCSLHAYFTGSDCSHILTYTVPSCPQTCGFTNMTAVPSGCITPTTYNVTGTLSFVNAPTTGQLIVQDCNGVSVSFNAPFTSPMNYTLSNLTPNGQPCDVTAHFTADPACTITSAYTAPIVPVVNAGNDVSICSGVSTTLNATGATSYSWDNGAGTNASATVSPSATTTYTVTGTTNGCSATDQVVVTISPNLQPTISPNTTICEGQSTTITASGGVAYVWDNGLSNVSSHTVSPATTTTYNVVVTDASGCSGPAQTTVTVNSNPVVTAANVSTCADEPVQIVASGALNYVWSPSTNLNTTIGNTVVFTPGTSTTYTITGADAAGCTGTTIVIASVLSNPVASFTPDPVTFTLTDPQVKFENTSTGATNYTWVFGDGSTSNLVSPSHTYPNEIAGYVVTLYATNDAGCIDSVSMTVRAEEDLIFYVPNAFTPDGDEFNQDFSPVFTSGFDPYDYTMIIYNRWGELVFETHDVLLGWNGAYGVGGQKCQSGIYTWKIEFKTINTDERKMFVGHVNLLK